MKIGGFSSDTDTVKVEILAANFNIINEQKEIFFEKLSRYLRSIHFDL
jgi:hypothetical protein